MTLVAGYSAAQVRAAEAPLLEKGVPLMRMAAAALAGVIRSVLGSQTGAVVLLVGSGDNGGDALYTGAELAADGHAVAAIAARERMHPAAAEAARSAGVELLRWEDDRARARAALVSSAVVVDGLLGTGTRGDGALRGAARDLVANAIEIVERTRTIVVAVDLPSGIHPDDGSVADPTVLRADVTVTFGAAKAGLLIEPGADYVGRLEVVDLGLALASVDPLVERA